jgi:AhpD family alkylhydroperoxidase
VGYAAWDREEVRVRVTVTSEQIRSAFEAVKDDPSFDESRALWEQGMPPFEMIQAMCLRPDLLRAFGGFGGSVYPGGLLERRIKELVIIAASERNDCQFCTNFHNDLVRIDGIVAERDGLSAVRDPSGLPPRERIAVQYTQAAKANSNAIPPSLAAELKERFTDPEIVELSFLIGYINMLNLFNNLLEVRYHGEYALVDPARTAGADPVAPQA